MKINTETQRDGEGIEPYIIFFLSVTLCLCVFSKFGSDS
jgi:hypothetical protein